MSGVFGKVSGKVSGVGAVLSQRGESGARKIISYASKKLRYSAVEGECLAMVWPVNRFRPYLEFGILSYLVITRHLNGYSKLAVPTRWALQLGAFDFEIRHVPGKRKGSRQRVILLFGGIEYGERRVVGE